MNEDRKQTENIDKLLKDINITVNDNDDSNAVAKERTRFFEEVKKLGEDKKFEFNIENLKAILYKARLANYNAFQACKEDFLEISFAIEILGYFKQQKIDLEFDGVDNDIVDHSQKRYEIAELIKFLDYMHGNVKSLSIELWQVFEWSVTEQDFENVVSLFNTCAEYGVKNGRISNILTIVKDGTVSVADMLKFLESSEKEGLSLKENDVKVLLCKIVNQVSPVDTLSLVKRLGQLGENLGAANIATIISKLSDKSLECMRLVFDELKSKGCINNTNIDDVFDRIKGESIDLLHMLDLLDALGLKLSQDNYQGLLRVNTDIKDYDYICSLLNTLQERKIEIDDDCFKWALKYLYLQNVDDMCKFINGLEDINIQLVIDEVCKESPYGYKIVYNEKYVGKVLEKLDSQSAQELSKLVSFLSDKKLLTMDVFIDIMKNKLASEQSANDVADLLIMAGNAIEWTKIGKNGDGSFKVSLDNILEKISSDQKGKDILKLAKVLIGMYKNLSIAAGKFRQKIKEYDQSNNNELEMLLKLNMNSDAASYNHIRGNCIKYIKGNFAVKKTKIQTKQGEGMGTNTHHDNNIIKDNHNGNNISGLTNPLSALLAEAVSQNIPGAQKYYQYYTEDNKNKKVNVDDKEKGLFVECIFNQLSYRLDDLSRIYEKRDKDWGEFGKALVEEKDFWKNTNKDLAQAGLFSDDKANEINRKIDDIYNLNEFVTFLQWFGCFLSAVLSLGGTLKLDCIRNRVFLHTKDARIFERWQDRKDSLSYPLPKITEKQQGNKNLNYDNI